MQKMLRVYKRTTSHSLQVTLTECLIQIIICIKCLEVSFEFRFKGVNGGRLPDVSWNFFPEEEAYSQLTEQF